MELDINITYRAGTENIVADALSRNCAVVQTSGQVPLSNLAAKQRKDIKLRLIIDTIENCSSSKYKNYTIEDQILHYNKKNHSYIVIPQSLIDDILYTHHDDMLSGHFSFEKTYKKISQKYFWENMITEGTTVKNALGVPQRNPHQRHTGLSYALYQ